MSTNGTVTEEAVALSLSPLSLERMSVEIRGITPLIAHRWSEKARKEMRDRQSQKAKPKKAAKDPDAEFEAARYRLPDGRDGFPAVAFKAAIVGAARLFDDITMVQLKPIIYVAGQGPDLLVPITYEALTMREDPVRVGPGTADLRYRPQYEGWGATLEIEFPSSQIRPESVLALVEAAGFGGVGEWRPSAPKGAAGMHGRFAIKGDA